MMTNRERDVYFKGLASSLTLQLSIKLNRDILIDMVEYDEAETTEESRVWIAGFQDGNKLAYMISEKMK